MSSAYFGEDDPIIETKTKETLKRKKTQGMYNILSSYETFVFLKFQNVTRRRRRRRIFVGAQEETVMGMSWGRWGWSFEASWE